MTEEEIQAWELEYGKWFERKTNKKEVGWKHLVDSEAKNKIHVIDLIASDGYEPIEHLNLLVGKPSQYTVSKKGKISIKPMPEQLHFTNIKKAPLALFVKKQNIKAMLLDSLTMVIDTKFSGEAEAFPARSKNNMQVCNQLQRVSSMYELYTIVNHHYTKNPINLYDVGTITGSKGTKHNFKFQAGISHYGSSPSKRWIRILRSQHKPKGIKSTFEITSTGCQEFVVGEK